MTRAAHASLVLAAAGTAVVMAAAPALAVQTTSFGLAATGDRTRLSHAAGTGTVADSVRLYNRQAKPITLQLSVIGVTRAPHDDYVLGGAGVGLARAVRVGASSVTLAPHASRTVPVTIDTSQVEATAEYAAVTAVQAPAASTGVSVQQRLAVLVAVTGGKAAPARATAATRHAAGAAAGKSSSDLRMLASSIAGLLVLVVAAAWVRRRRRT
jgi:hypothetical protein